MTPIEQWESNMLVYGKKILEILKANAMDFDHMLDTTYYDGEFVFRQIAEYTKDTTWLDGAMYARSIYRDKYLLPNNGNLPGRYNLTHGLTLSALAGDTVSKNAVKLIATQGAFARDSTPTADTIPPEVSRDVAFVIHNYLNTERLGETERTRFLMLVGHARGHIQKWVGGTAAYIRPFMVALTSHALIDYHESRKNPSAIVADLQNIALKMWNELWVSTAKSFKYTDRIVDDPHDMDPAPDLNLLICPLYAWLYKQTGDEGYKEKADLIFAGGVEKAALHDGKHFNQNYRWSFKYVEWMRASRENDFQKAKFYLDRALSVKV